MAARNTDVSLTADTWTQLTASDVTALRVQNMTRFVVIIQATVGATPPAGATLADQIKGGIRLLPDMGIATDLTLATMFPGVAGATRVYATCAYNVDVSVSHA